jgi:hypothetical protein
MHHELLLNHDPDFILLCSGVLKFPSRCFRNLATEYHPTYWLCAAPPHDAPFARIDDIDYSMRF